jgi:hypothetical protein
MKIVKKSLAFSEQRCYYTCVALSLGLNYLKFLEGGAAQWQNANFVVKTLLSVLRFLTHTDVQTELGNQTLKELKQLLTVLHVEYMLAHAACAPVRLHVLFNA